MNFLRSVDGHSHEPVIRSQQLAPVLVNEDGVSLQRMIDALPFAAVMLLEPDQLLEEVEACKCGLPALKREGAGGVRIEEISIDQALESLRCHQAPGQVLVRVRFAIEVEAIGAVEIADCRDGFDQQRCDAWCASWPLREVGKLVFTPHIASLAMEFTSCAKRM
jgi:hypothetical protein